MSKAFQLFLLLLTSIAYGQSDFKALDSILDLYKDKPGISVVVTKKNKIIYQRNSGYADLEPKTKISPETIFYLASVSKQFTASCTVLLHQQGKLNLDDKLSKYFLEFPPYADKITIRNLLNHTSGLKDSGTLAAIKGDDIFTYINYTNDDIRQMLAKQQTDFEPGSDFSYTNSGYWCLVQIVEQVSGVSINEFAQKYIFKPLQMNARYVILPDNNFDNKAKGYVLKDSEYIAYPADGYAIGGGGVWATAGDLQKWLTEMEENTILGKDFWDIMLKDQLYKAKKITYAKGLFVENYGPNKYYYHGGAIEGFKTRIVYFPATKIGVIILSNNEDTDCDKILPAAVASNLWMNYKASKKEPKKEYKALSVSVLQQYTGSFELKPGTSITVFHKENKDGLFAVQQWDGGEARLKAVGDDSFIVEGKKADFSFLDIKDGKAGIMRFTDAKQQMDFKRVDNKVIADAFRAFEGIYYCESLNVSYTFFTEDGLFRYKIADKKTSDVAAFTGKDTFSIKGADIVFERVNGAMTAFELSCSRAKKIKFVKKG